jgi:hypothetical protein
MSITQEEFRKRIHEIIQDKIFFSNISGNPVEVVEKLPEEIVPGKVLFDGLMLFDGIEGIEDDIQQMTSYTKDGCIVNLEDYYTDSGAFDDDGWDRFMVALGRLMTVDEFSQYIDKNGIGSELPYPIDENGHAEIPVGTLYIKDEAFMNCSKLVSVTLPDTVLEIRDRAFCGCNNLASIELPAYVRLIAPSAFNGCTSLASVVFSTIGALLIEEQAFAGCTSLTDVEFKTSPTVIVRHAFEGCPCEEEVMRKSDY